MKELVTVIVPNYNHEQYLKERLNSIIHQTYQTLEILLMDDCSTDQSISILKEYAALDHRISCFFNTENSGSTFFQWNKGINLAKGKYIWIAESDDYSDITFVEKMVNLIEKDSNVSFVFSSSNVLNEKGEVRDIRIKPVSSAEVDFFCNSGVYDGNTLITRLISYKNIIPNASAVLLRKDSFQKCGGADTNYKIAADWKLWFELSLNAKIGYIHENLNYYRRHPQAVTLRKIDILKSEALKNSLYFYMTLKGQKLSVTNVFRMRYDWIFKGNVWSSSWSFSWAKLNEYFELATLQSFWIFLRLTLRYLYYRK